MLGELILCQWWGVRKTNANSYTQEPPRAEGRWCFGGQWLIWKLTCRKIENEQSDHPAASILPSAKTWNARSDVSHIPGWDFPGRNTYTGQGIKNLQRTSRFLLHAWESWLILAQEIHAVHSVVSGLAEGTGHHGGCVGHWPGWYSSLTPGPAPRKLSRSSKNELWCRKPDSSGATKQVPLECISRRRL